MLSFVGISGRLSAFLPVCASVCLHVGLSVCQSFCIPVFLHISLPAYQPAWISVASFICFAPNVLQIFETGTFSKPAFLLFNAGLYFEVCFRSLRLRPFFNAYFEMRFCLHLKPSSSFLCANANSMQKTVANMLTKLFDLLQIQQFISRIHQKTI